MKQILEQIEDNWKMLKDKLEIDIVEKHSYIARFFILIFMGKKSNALTRYI